MLPPERSVLNNGIVFLHRSSHSLPLVAGTLLFRTGSYYEPAAQAGLASLTGDLLLQGTRKHKAQVLADRMESMGASLSVQTSEDYTEMDFVAPSQHLDRALDVISEVLQTPHFPQDEIQKERSQTLASLASRKDTIFTVAHDRFNTMLYDQHPYGRPVDGFPDTVRRLKRHDFQAWHRSQFRPDTTIVSLVTPAKTSEVQKKVMRFLGTWTVPEEQAGLVDVAALPDLRAGRSDFLQGTFEQAYLMTGVQAPAAFDPGYMGLKLLNTLFGGGMSSRLFVQLREKLGLAYEVSSFFPTHLRPSQWVIYLGLPGERLPLAKRKLEELLAELAEKGPTESELVQARRMMKGAFVMERQTRRRQGWHAAWWEFLGRAPDYEGAYLKRLDAVTRKELRELAKRLLSRPRVTVEIAAKGSVR